MIESTNIFKRIFLGEVCVGMCTYKITNYSFNRKAKLNQTVNTFFIKREQLLRCSIVDFCLVYCKNYRKAIMTILNNLYEIYLSVDTKSKVRVSKEIK